MPDDLENVPNQAASAPEGQQAQDDQGNDQGQQSDQGQSQSPTDFVELEGVKVPQSAFEKIAKERYKDAFEAQANRDKWQAENTRKAQELKQLERDAEAFRRLQAENRPQPKNPIEAQRQAYIEKKSKAFPDVDPRFFESQYDDMMEIAGLRAKESMSPILEKQSQEWEQKFLQDHPLVQPGSEGYQKLAGLLQRGYEPEDAYRIVYQKELMEKEFETRRKAEDAERLRKLKGAPANSQDGEKPMTGTRSDRIWRAMEKAGVSRE